MSVLPHTTPAGQAVARGLPRSRAGEHDTLAARAAARERWQNPSRGYYRELIRLVRMHIPPGASVLQVSCGMGDVLAGAQPACGVGIDANPEVVTRARRRYPDLTFVADDPETFQLDQKFDYVILGDSLVEMGDVQACLERIRTVCRPDTRIIISYINPLWEPALRTLSFLRLRRKNPRLNWLSTYDVHNLLELAGFKVVRHNYEMLLPARIPLLTLLCNRVLARVWPTQYLSLVHLLIARPDGTPEDAENLTCSVIIPTHNERGNIESAIRRTPKLGRHTELIFVDGNSTDGTEEEIQRLIAAYPERDIKLVRQGEKRGKGDAMRKGYAAATGDVLMCLDADLTVQPEELPKFFDCIAGGKAEFVNGTRLVYPMEKRAMRMLNKLANWFFSVLFSWLLDQRFRDTLCGTKVMHRKSYAVIAANRSYFGGFDPFGDFDLIFGASKANLQILEIPVHYKARTYGETSINRFRDGLKLFQMSAVALWKLKLR